MTLKDILRTLDQNLLVEVGRMDGSPIITTRAKSWRCLDDGLLGMPVSSIGGGTERNHNGAVSVILATQWPVCYVSSVEELQTAMDDDEITAVALASDIQADEDTLTLLTFNSGQIKSLDLNGYMLAATNAETADTVTAIMVTGGGALNIYDSEGAGEIFGGKHAGGNYCIYVDGGSMVNIYGGYFTTGAMGDESVYSHTVYVHNGCAHIYGGYLEDTSYTALTPADDVLKAGEAGAITVYGGVIVEQNPEKFLAPGKHTERSARYYDTLYRVVGK